MSSVGTWRFLGGIARRGKIKKYGGWVCLSVANRREEGEGGREEGGGRGVGVDKTKPHKHSRKVFAGLKMRETLTPMTCQSRERFSENRENVNQYQFADVSKVIWLGTGGG